MTKVDDSAAPGVAVLIDFENLAYGLADANGPSDAAVDVDLDVMPMLSFAEEHGAIAYVRAYADWRFKDVNRHQMQLFRAGVDIVHVFSRFGGQQRRNAADVRMAVDATESIWTMPHVHTYMIVSGDRDFIHVLKTLRRYGKRVIGVAVASSASKDFAILCDRFMTYASLVQSYSDASVEGRKAAEIDSQGLDSVKDELEELLAKHPEGIVGSAVKLALRRSDPTFDEARFGFRSFRSFLQSLSDSVTVQVPSGPGDIRAFPIGAELPAAQAVGGPLHASPRQGQLLRDTGLKRYRFIPGRAQRRDLFERLWRLMNRPEGVTWHHVADALLEDDEIQLPLSTSLLGKLWSMLWHGRAIDLRDADSELPMKESTLHLIDAVRSADDLLQVYEATAMYKVVDALGEDVRDEDAALILDLDLEDGAQRAYLQDLRDAVRAKRQDDAVRANRQGGT